MNENSNATEGGWAKSASGIDVRRIRRIDFVATETAMKARMFAIYRTTIRVAFVFFGVRNKKILRVIVQIPIGSLSLVVSLF